MVSEPASTVERFFTMGLAQVAYLVADEEAGVAAVIDPRRDVAAYFDWAAARRLRIVAILETHVHADFVSGARELAAATAAPIHTGAAGHQEFPLSPATPSSPARWGTRTCSARGRRGDWPSNSSTRSPSDSAGCPTT